jgi:hypothetical protein
MLKADLRFRRKQTFIFEARISGPVIQRRKSSFPTGGRHCTGSSRWRSAPIFLCGGLKVRLRKNFGAFMPLWIRYPCWMLVFFISSTGASNAGDSPPFVAQKCTDIPNNRYKVLSDSSQVLDKFSDLVWQRCSIGQVWNGSTCIETAKTYSWEAANKISKTFQADLIYGWRLPNIVELSSLSVMDGCSVPSINTTVFPATAPNFYWSSSEGSSIGVPVGANLDFRTGYGNYADPHYESKTSNNYVRLVRKPCKFEWLQGLWACR